MSAPNTLNIAVSLKRASESQTSPDNPRFALDLALTLPTQGITAIFGPSGSGKTTLLRCIAGLEQAQQANIEFGQSIWQSSEYFLPTHKRPIGYVFQEASLFPHLTAQGNLNYAMKRSGKKTPSEFYQSVINVMGIAPILPKYPEQLSGGERQRVAIARALLIQPQLLLMDEPLASLDHTRKQEILPYLEQLKNQFDIPILYVSHSMDEVARLADYAVTLDQGKVTASGPLEEVFSSLDTHVNLDDDAGVILKGNVLEKDPHWHLSKIGFSGSESHTLWLKDQGENIGDAVRVRILARDISIALSCHEDSSILNRLQTEIVGIAHDGDSMTRLRLKTGEHFLIARITHKSFDQLKLDLGMKVWAQIKSVALVR